MMPKAMVVAPADDAEVPDNPRPTWRGTVLYEAHVRGLTGLHPDVPDEDRGTYLGLASRPVIEHLKGLGASALLLLPVFEFIDERYLIDRDLSNYWGFNPIAFFAPTARYARADPVAEFRQMVERLHAAGLEVLLWVDSSHSAEGNHIGPTLSFRGIDNAGYYRLASEPRYYEDVTGTGNTLNGRSPVTQRFLLDCLRCWVSEMKVDGFCFELATTLARDGEGFSPDAPLLRAIREDPIVGQAKLIAEPWDLGQGGYQAGNFPQGWTELSGRTRDTIRSYWRGDPGTAADLAYSLTGWRAVVGKSAAERWSPIDFVTMHDGFTLEDLVSYNEKHNNANQEQNRDGQDQNLSWNCGVEGPTDDRQVLATRARLKRAMLTTLFLCDGVPLVLAGDEIGKSQGGNNNAYCQDNETTWLDWAGHGKRPDEARLGELIARLAELRRTHPAFEHDPSGEEERDVYWFTPEGREMTDDDWRDAAGFAMAVRWAAGDIPRDVLLALFTPSPGSVQFGRPMLADVAYWETVLDTAEPWDEGVAEKGIVGGRSVIVLNGAVTPVAPSHDSP
jgi:glycogen operon protein